MRLCFIYELLGLITIDDGCYSMIGSAASAGAIATVLVCAAAALLML